jgi:transcriptional regulator with XRE-family HTH domain
MNVRCGDLTTDPVAKQAVFCRIGRNFIQLQVNCSFSGRRSGIMVRMKMVDKIEKVLELRGLKQYQLEEELGLAVNRISKWKGTGEPTASQAFQIARFFEVDLEWLVDDADETWPPPAASPILDEIAILRVIRAYRIDTRTAIERLTRDVIAPVKPELASGESLDAWAQRSRDAVQ